MKDSRLLFSTGEILTAVSLALQRVDLRENFAEAALEAFNLFVVQAVARLGAVDFAANQPGVFEVLEVLRYGRLRQGQRVDEVAAHAVALVGEQLQNCEAGGVGKRLGCFGDLLFEGGKFGLPI